MAQISEHVQHTQPHNGLETSHTHPSFTGHATFKHDGVEGDLTFNGSNIVVGFKGRESHFHINIDEELTALIEAVKRGDYNIY